MSNPKLVRLVGHDYHIFEVLSEDKDNHEVTVKRITPEIDEEGHVITVSNPITVYVDDIIDNDPEALLMFVRIYNRSVSTRLLQLHALQTSLMRVIDILTGNDENQSHR
jgi:hypothetical protein